LGAILILSENQNWLYQRNKAKIDFEAAHCLHAGLFKRLLPLPCIAMIIDSMWAPKYERNLLWRSSLDAFSCIFLCTLAVHHAFPSGSEAAETMNGD
jgi:hypothetical protein